MSNDSEKVWFSLMFPCVPMILVAEALSRCCMMSSLSMPYKCSPYPSICNVKINGQFSIQIYVKISKLKISVHKNESYHFPFDVFVDPCLNFVPVVPHRIHLEIKNIIGYHWLCLCTVRLGALSPLTLLRSISVYLTNGLRH
jgi:hypothetical protein